MTKAPQCGAFVMLHPVNQKKEANRTERTLSHAQMINAVTTTMGKP
jgi:hypothetical protein